MNKGVQAIKKWYDQNKDFDGGDLLDDALTEEDVRDIVIALDVLQEENVHLRNALDNTIDDLNKVRGNVSKVQRSMETAVTNYFHRIRNIEMIEESNDQLTGRKK